MSSENDTMNSQHLTIEELITLSMIDKRHPHLEQCAFCREQLAMLEEIESFDETYSLAAAEPEYEYRLAAAGNPDMNFRLRRTWYLESNTILLRVIENEIKDILKGYVITNAHDVAKMRIQFSGLDELFTPDASGIFIIGPASIDIESMDVKIIL